MFSLIITIISIALVGALALATLYFGGDAFNQGSAKAAASTLVNQASQINGANTLFFLDNQAYGDMSDLTDGYLASAPNPGAISAEDYVIDSEGQITLASIPAAVCAQVNEQAGLTAVSNLEESGLEDVQFGCHTTGEGEAAVHTFLFK